MTIALTAHPSPLTTHPPSLTDHRWPNVPASLALARRASRHALWIATGRPGALAAAYLVNYADAERGASGTDPFGTGIGRSRSPLDTAWHWAAALLADDLRKATTDTFKMLAPYTWLTQDGLI